MPILKESVSTALSCHLHQVLEQGCQLVLHQRPHVMEYMLCSLISKHRKLLALQQERRPDFRAEMIHKVLISGCSLEDCTYVCINPTTDLNVYVAIEVVGFSFEVKELLDSQPGGVAPIEILLEA